MSDDIEKIRLFSEFRDLVEGPLKDRIATLEAERDAQSARLPRFYRECFGVEFPGDFAAVSVVKHEMSRLNDGWDAARADLARKQRAIDEAMQAYYRDQGQRAIADILRSEETQPEPISLAEAADTARRIAATAEAERLQCVRIEATPEPSGDRAVRLVKRLAEAIVADCEYIETSDEIRAIITECGGAT